MFLPIDPDIVKDTALERYKILPSQSQTVFGVLKDNTPYPG